MWTYVQTSGRLWKPDIQFQCYSGLGDGKDNPELQWVHGVGPLPCGLWTMGDWIAEHPHLGRGVIPLTPDPDTATFGRTGFYFHGDSVTNPGNGSHGCIVHSPLADRQLIHQSGDRRLLVVKV